MAQQDSHDNDDFPEYDDALGERLAGLDDAEAEQRANALRVGLDEYELDDEDVALLDAGELGEDGVHYLPAYPVLAIVGRPNVGKSALVNRIIGRREAVVQDVPGVTRDRVSYKAEWNDKRFTLVDTGGWEPDARGINASVAAQAEVAVDLADAVLFVVDVTVGITATDEHVVKMLRGTDRPVIVVANKADDDRRDLDAFELWNLGLGEPHPVSALHGRGVADLMDLIIKTLPDTSAVAKQEVGGPRRVAILGRPNVGKSSLLNKAAGEERVVVNDLAGTTRDPVDEQIELGGRVWRFVDTAGIRKRVHLQQGADFYASLRTTAALEKAEVAVVVLDVTEPISTQDLRIIDLVLESGRALVLAYNKWDLLDDDDVATSSARSSRTWRTSPGPRASTSPPGRAVTSRSSCRRSRPRSSRGTPASRPARSTPSSPSSCRSTRTRSVAASSPASCSGRRRRASRRRSCCSPRRSSTRSTAASSRVACARCGASTAPRSTSTCGCASAASARNGRSTTWHGEHGSDPSGSCWRSPSSSARSAPPGSSAGATTGRGPAVPRTGRHVRWGGRV